MKALHMVTFLLMAIGGINWGLVGLLHLNVVEMLFGMGSMLTMLVYVLVGASSVYVLVTHKSDCKICSKK